MNDLDIHWLFWHLLYRSALRRTRCISCDMKTYFCRINAGCDITAETFFGLWRERRVAIHYPWTKGKVPDPKSKRPDTRSTNPNDFDGSAARAVRKMNEISKCGGYILVEQYALLPSGGRQRRFMVGFIKPGSKIELFQGRWGTQPGRTAVLKTLRLHRARVIAEAIPELNFGKPRQGTITEWRAAEDLVERLVEGKSLRRSVRNLTPSQAEVLCSEFLRSPSRAFRQLRIESLLAPVGRTMHGVDVWGIGATGTDIIAQVTNATDERIIENKLSKLISVAGDSNAELVLFAPQRVKINNSRIHQVPIEIAFEQFLAISKGHRWWNRLRRLQPHPLRHAKSLPRPRR